MINMWKLKKSTGLLLVEIGPNAVYNGYTDKKASEEKVIHDVMVEGDRWFNLEI